MEAYIMKRWDGDKYVTEEVGLEKLPEPQEKTLEEKFLEANGYDHEFRHSHAKVCSEIAHSHFSGYCDHKEVMRVFKNWFNEASGKSLEYDIEKLGERIAAIPTVKDRT